MDAYHAVSPETRYPMDMSSEEELLTVTMMYNQMVMLYEAAIQCVTTRIDILEQEQKARGWHKAIHSVTGRIKQPMSIINKLKKQGKPISVNSIQENLNDVAGVRVICSYIQDIYSVRDSLLRSNEFKLIKEKDYIQHPKANGYRSLHLIIEVPVPLRDGKQLVRCEIQLRTTAMDAWASLEHQLMYKSNNACSEDTLIDLKMCAELFHTVDRKMEEIASHVSSLENSTERGSQPENQEVYF